MVPLAAFKILVCPAQPPETVVNLHLHRLADLDHGLLGTNRGSP